jgi:hypothetical protein
MVLKPRADNGLFMEVADGASGPPVIARAAVAPVRRSRVGPNM